MAKPEDDHGKKDPKVVTIYIDGTPHDVPKKDDISYDEVVVLADPTYAQNPQNTYSVSYTHGQGHKPEGILAPGASVKVKEGMRFRVNKTGQS